MINELHHEVIQPSRIDVIIYMKQKEFLMKWVFGIGYNQIPSLN
jgi:hypothetical protein